MLGISLAVLMSQAKWVERSIFPYAVALQTVPILALTPPIGQFFDFNFRSRVIVCVIISLFPIIANTLFGLLSADQGHHDLFRLHGASRWTRLWKLQFPGALPAIFVGLRISAGLSVIGAIVGDFFFRRGDPGLGVLITNYQSRLQSEQMYGALILASSSASSPSGVRHHRPEGRRRLGRFGDVSPRRLRPPPTQPQRR